MNIHSSLKGKKTYITGITGIISMAGLYLVGDIGLAEFIQGGTQLLIAIFLRAGIKDIQNKR